MLTRVLSVVALLTVVSGCTPVESEIPDEASATMTDGSTSSTTIPDSSSSTSSSTTADDPSTSGEPDPTTTGSTTSPDPSTSGTTAPPDPECGDGHVDNGEECDEGPENDNSGACTEACTLAKCGDGYLQGDEECDLGTENDNEGECTNTCALPYCGDGFVQGDEECDKPDDKNGVCDPDTCKLLTTCGDGMLQEYEECDKSAGGDLAAVCDQCLIVRKVIFASSKVYPGGFKAIQLADHECQVLAKAALLPNDGSFIAWLSAPGQPVSARLSPDPFKYGRVDGLVVAENVGDLLDGQLNVPISIDEFGDDATMISGFAWTGTHSNGDVAPETCFAWTSASPADKGVIGSLSLPGEGWTKSMSSPCSSKQHLYCVET